MLSPDTNSPCGLFVPGEGPGLCARRALQGAAICEAASRPHIRFVPIKTVEQQSMLAVHSLREGIKQDRNACINRIRGLLLEFGVAIPTGVRALEAALDDVLEDASNEMNGLARITLRRAPRHRPCGRTSRIRRRHQGTEKKAATPTPIRSEPTRLAPRDKLNPRPSKITPSAHPAPMMGVFNHFSSALRTARRARSAGSIYRRGTPTPPRTSPGPVQQTDQIAASRDLSLIVRPHWRCGCLRPSIGWLDLNQSEAAFCHGQRPAVVG